MELFATSYYFKEEEDQINRSHSLKVVRVLKIKSPYLIVHRVSVNKIFERKRFFKNHFHRARLTPTAFPQFSCVQSCLYRISNNPSKKKKKIGKKVKTLSNKSAILSSWKSSVSSRPNTNYSRPRASETLTKIPSHHTRNNSRVLRTRIPRDEIRPAQTFNRERYSSSNG